MEDFASDISEFVGKPWGTGDMSNKRGYGLGFSPVEMSQDMLYVLFT